MSEGFFKVGDKVLYKVGRGKGKGTVQFSSEDLDFVVIRTTKGKEVSRKLEQVEKDNG